MCVASEAKSMDGCQGKTDSSSHRGRLSRPTFFLGGTTKRGREAQKENKKEKFMEGQRRRESLLLCGKRTGKRKKGGTKFASLKYVKGSERESESSGRRTLLGNARR